MTADKGRLAAPGPDSNADRGFRAGKNPLDVYAHRSDVCVVARDDRLTPNQRLDAIAEIFARGVSRLLLKEERERGLGEKPTRSGVADPDAGHDECTAKSGGHDGTE